jgi:uncharacterized membrane protein YgcG
MNRNWLSGAALATSLAAIGGTPAARAQDGPAPMPRPAELVAPDAAAGFTAADLDALVAPIALYPDALLTQIFVAATYPLDLVKADRFLAEAASMSDKDRAAAAEAEPWDPSVQLLAGGFPTVVRMMAQDLDWTERLGDAVIAQTGDVLDAVQRMRTQAAAAGNLATNAAQVVEVDDGAITVTPADPEVVYVPTYDPALAYAPATAPVVVQDSGTSDLLMMGAVTFGTALLVNEIYDDDWDDYWDDDWDSGHGHHGHIDWDDAEFYPRRDVDIDGDVNIDVDRTRIEGGGVRIGDVDREVLRDERREAGGWEPTAEQRDRAQSSIERRQGEGAGAAAAAGLAGGAIAARSQGGGEARARLEAANAKRPPQQKFEGSASLLEPRRDTPARAAQDRERGAGSVERRQASPAKARPEAAARPKSVSKPAQAKKPVRKPPQASSAFKKQGGGAKAKASSNRGARSAGGRSGGGGAPRRR